MICLQCTAVNQVSVGVNDILQTSCSRLSKSQMVNEVSTRIIIPVYTSTIYTSVWLNNEAKSRFNLVIGEAVFVLKPLDVKWLGQASNAIYSLLQKEETSIKRKRCGDKMW